MTKLFDLESRNMRLFALVAAIMLGGLIAYLSLIGSSSGPHFQWSDKVQHFIAYTALTLPLALFLGRGRFIWAILAAGFYGVLLEFAQGWLTDDRIPSALDAIANLLGACAGVCIAIICLRVLRVSRA